MKILFANGRQTYPLFQGGDCISFHHLFSQLHLDGHKILSVGKLNPPHLNLSEALTVKKLSSLKIKPKKKNSVISYLSPGGYECQLLEDKKFLVLLPNIIDSFRPDIILTQLDCSEEIISIAAASGVKIIHFIHDHDPLNYLALNKSYLISHVVFNSKNTAQHFKSLLRCESSIIYPPIKLEDYICKQREQKLITMINPTIKKGIRIVEALASKFPQEKFVLVKGWKKPEISDDHPSNISIWERQYDMTLIYSQTKILLVPSQWEETFGRVIPEAGINRIPIVASRIGGIPESVGREGILIDDFNTPDAWCTAISQVLVSQKLCKDLGQLAFKQAKKFDMKKIYPQLISVFNTVYHS